MRKLIFVILLLTISILLSAQEGQDLENGVNQQIIFKCAPGAPPNFLGNVKVQTVTIPFEGYTNYDGLNRYDHVRYGCLQKRYFRHIITNEIFSETRPISYVNDNYSSLTYNNWVGTSHTSAYPNSTNSLQIALLCGFAKYKFTLEVQETGEIYTFYMDYSDSKYGKFNFFSLPNSDFNNYIRRFEFRYVQSKPLNNRLEMWELNPNSYIPVAKIEDLWTENTPNYSTPEYQIWELATRNTSYYRTTPFEELFYIQGTPFPTSYNVAKDTLAEVSLFTTVIMNDILPRIITMENSNINTDMFYYEHPTIPIVERPYTVLSPGYNSGPNINNEFGMKLKIENGGNLILGENIKYGIVNLDDFECLNGAKVTLNENAKLFTRYINTPLLPNYPQGEGDHGNILLNNCEFLGSSNSKIEINQNGRLTINGIVTLNNVILDLKQSGKVYFGENAKLVIKNGGCLIANGSVISSINPSLPGEGIILENAGASTVITGCTFNNLTSAVTLYNDNMTSANTYRYIYGNVFNMINGNRYGLHTYNAHNSTIQNNTFNLSVGDGFGLVMRYSLPPGEDETPPIYSININNNAFNNGTVSAAFLCYTSEYVPMNVSYNNFNSASLYNVIGRHITGDIRYNTLNSVTAGSQCKSIELTQSTPGLYSNTVSSNYKNLYSYDSYENLAPIPENGNLILTGGYNRFTSIGNGNVYFYGGKALLDYGYNCFLKNINPAYNHLEGAVNEPTLLYYMRNNDFNNSNMPVHSLVEYESGSVVVPFVDGSNYTCQISTDAGNIWIIRDLGNGVIDTIYSKPDNTGYQQPQDASLYSTAMARKTGGLYFDAVSYFKALINNHAASAYTDACLYNLYECHERLDTSSSQEIRNILYGSLKIYLENKILSGLYSDEFNFNAYNIVLMCETNMTDYNSAMAGYEFIALYHPEAYIRLLASWDYAELEELINGGGGLSSRIENMSDEKFLQKLTKKINKSISEDPVRAAVKKSYNRVKSENTARDEKEIYSRNKNTKEAENELTMMKQIEYNFNSRTLNVLRNAKTMTREEKSQRQMEDILTKLKDKKGSYAEHGTNTLPENYDLSQNYPNPFNPVTKINYALPKQGFVTLKIYDITGREVKVLVNEFRQAGYYTIDFNGSNLASGVYFYRIQSGSFISVKKMVLIK